MDERYIKYIGLPYKERGRTMEGVDCWGLIRLIVKEILNAELPSYDGRYPSEGRRSGPEIKKIVEGELVGWNYVEEEWVRVNKEKEGLVVIMKGGDYVLHAGFVCEVGKMIHVVRGERSVCERYNSPLWRPKIRGFYEYAGSSL